MVTRILGRVRQLHRQQPWVMADLRARALLEVLRIERALKHNDLAAAESSFGAFCRLVVENQVYASAHGPEATVG
jgi:hypothetical protein